MIKRVLICADDCQGRRKRVEIEYCDVVCIYGSSNRLTDEGGDTGFPTPLGKGKQLSLALYCLGKHALCMFEYIS